MNKYLKPPYIEDTTVVYATNTGWNRRNELEPTELGEMCSSCDINYALGFLAGQTHERKQAAITIQELVEELSYV